MAKHVGISTDGDDLITIKALKCTYSYSMPTMIHKVFFNSTTIEIDEAEALAVML